MSNLKDFVLEVFANAMNSLVTAYAQLQTLEALGEGQPEYKAAEQAMDEAIKKLGERLGKETMQSSLIESLRKLEELLEGEDFNEDI